MTHNHTMTTILEELLPYEQVKPCLFCGWGTIVDGGWFGRYKAVCIACGASTASKRTWPDAYCQRILGTMAFAVKQKKEGDRYAGD